MAETSCKCFVFSVRAIGRRLNLLQQKQPCYLFWWRKVQRRSIPRCLFLVCAKKITVKLNLSSSSNLEVSNFAQHVPSRTAPQILNEPQNRKQLKVAAQDPLLHRPTLGLNHQGRYPWFLLCYCLGRSQLDYLVANEHPWYSSKKALSLLVQTCPSLDFVVMHKHSFYERHLLQTSKYLLSCFLKSQIARNCSGLQKTPCDIFYSGEYKDMDLKHCLHVLSSRIAAEP